MDISAAIEEDAERMADARLVDILVNLLRKEDIAEILRRARCSCMKCNLFINRYTRLKIDHRQMKRKWEDSNSEFWRKRMHDIFGELQEAQTRFYETSCSCGRRDAPRWGPNVRKKVRA